MKKKIYPILAALAALTVFAFAETQSDGDMKMRLKASRDGSLYKMGEPAEFVLEISNGGKPQGGIRFWSSVSKDGAIPVVSSHGITDKDGRAVIKAGRAQRARGSQVRGRRLQSRDEERNAAPGRRGIRTRKNPPGPARPRGFRRILESPKENAFGDPDERGDERSAVRQQKR